LPKDRRLFRSSAKHMLDNHSEGQQELWIQSVDMARLKMLQTTALACTNLSIFMHNWLMYGSGATVDRTAQEEEHTPRDDAVE
jgi:hypothetical protein